MKIKTGDMVIIKKGKDAGKTGKVLQVFPVLNKVVVEGANKAAKHLKKRGSNPGQKIEFTAPIPLANVALIGRDGSGRVGYKFIEKDGAQKKVRTVRTKKGVADVE